jgi:hypothetical protein
MNKYLGKLFSFGLVLVMFFAIFVPVYAQDSNPPPQQADTKLAGFGLRPEDLTIGYYTYYVQPGSVVEDGLRVINVTDFEKYIRVSKADASSGLTGDVAIVEDDAEGISTWVEFLDFDSDSGAVVLSPKEEKLFKFRVTVPEGTPEGEYYAGFVAAPFGGPEASDEESSPEDGGFVVQIVPKVGVTVKIVVGEPNSCAMKIDSITQNLDYGRWNLSVNLDNIGNVGFRSDGNITIKKVGDASEFYERDFSVGFFVTGTSIPFPVYAPVPSPGLYEVEVLVKSKDFENCEARYSGEIEILPAEANKAAEEALDRDVAMGYRPETNNVTVTIILIVGILLLIVVLLLFFLFFLPRRKKEKEEAEAELAAKEAELERLRRELDGKSGEKN